MKKLFLLLLMVATMSVAVAQTRTVSGVVTYEGDGEPLAGVTIMPIGGGHGTSTDIDGKFTLSVPASVKKIRVTYVGMVAQEVAPAQNMKIVMQTADKKLDDVIVVAYGTAKKSAYTGSASVVNAEQIGDAMVTDAVNALKGTVPGVQITSANGQPGSSPSVRIRGIGSISASTSPLYVLDGMPFDGDIASINTMDIESMTVLKDAAAAALYGARGANGVILLTTKKGKDGSARVTLDARWGGNTRAVKNYNTVTSPAQYYEMGYAAIYNGFVKTQGVNGAHALANQMLNNPTVDSNAFGPGYNIWTVTPGTDLVGLNGKLNPNATLGYSSGTNYFTPDDWAANTFENGLRQEYNLSLQGGTDKFNYYVSGGYLSDEGIIVGSDYKRISTRTAIDYQAKSWLKIGTNMAYNHVSNGYPNDQGTTNSGQNAALMANSIAPIYPMFVRDASGNIINDNSTGLPIYDYGDGLYTGGAIRSFYNNSNAVSDLIYSSRRYFFDVFNGKWYATITPVTNFNITTNLGYFLDNTRMHERTSKLYGLMASYGGTAEQHQSRTSAVNFQVLGTYHHTIADKHNFDYLLGYESYERNWESIAARGYNLYNPFNWTVNNTLIDEKRKGYGSAGSYATRGLLARVNYDYETKYYVSGSFRRDASSRFAPNKRWGNFFSVSAAWDIAKEDFLKESNVVDMLKVKASFGQQGNDGILDSDGNANYYPYMDQYSVSGVTEWSDGVLSYKGNPDLTWETSNTWNAGIDFSFKDGLVNGTVEYFRRTVDDMLYNRPVPPSMGYAYIPMNVGSIRNQGVEIDLNVRPVKTRNITWELNFNGTYIDSKVLKLHPDLKGELISGTRIFREGEALYQLYLPVYMGVNNVGYVTDLKGNAILDAEGNKLALNNLGAPTFLGVFTDYTHPVSYDATNPDHKGKNDKGFALDANGNVIYDTIEGITTDFNNANSKNRKTTGSLLPKFYGGFGTTFRAYGFDVAVQFAFQVGGKVYDQGYTRMMHSGGKSDLGFAWHQDMLNAWTPENTNTNIPKLDTNANYTLSGQYTTFGLVSSNYLSLNNITVGYNLPDKFVGKLGLESVRFYCAGDNLCLWTKRKGLDPRNSLAGYLNSNLYYSAIRNISGGIRVVF